MTPAELDARIAAHLEAARQALATLRGSAGSGGAGTDGDASGGDPLAIYDRIAIELDASMNRTGLLERVHPDLAVRTAAEKWTQELAQFATELSLDRAVYDALTARPAPSDPITRHYLERTLRDFRRAGVDRDEATRARIRAINDELVTIGQDFARNIQSDRRSVALRVEDLAGLPEDYVRAHPPDAEGRVTITTDYPDYVPFMSYAESGTAREALYRAFRSRGAPANLGVLTHMLARRHELVQLLGYRSWAHYITEDKMIGSDTAAAEFIERIAAIGLERARRDYAELLERKRRDVPDAQSVHDWEKDYYEERIKAERYDFDSQAVRAYFPYDQVKQGVLDVTARLFGVEYRRVSDAQVWAPDVETYDLYEDGECLGRFHLDMHPRQDKYKHAAQFTLQNGLAGRQLPEAALVCNFPGGEPGDPGLMEHDDVVTFFHEFGHLLHNLFAGRLPWMGVAGISTEWDFVEAPSQMLEEWAWDPHVLRTFGRHWQTGEPIPTAWIERMRRARQFGRGTYVRQQMYYAMLSLRLHAGDPTGVDTTALVAELQNQYSMFRYVEGTTFHTSFGHLDGYSAIYYTYMWSLVIARDMFSEFDPRDLMAPDIAARYRRTVLDPGGSAPAATLVERFLGRPFRFDAYEKWLNES
jgi:thimet oligopeptidase